MIKRKTALKRKPFKAKRSPLKKTSKAHTHGWWMKKTKTDFNKCIRLRDSNKDGMLTCITCGARVHYKEAHAGHYVHTLHFVEINQHGQCARCNKYLSGNLSKYTLYMIDKYGREKVDELHREGHQPHKYLISDFKEMRAGYRQKIKELENLKNG